MLIYLQDNWKASAGDGGNFKSQVWTDVAEHMEKLRTVGGPKTAKACKNKWDAVRVL
jgi:hypothetical protein